MDLTTPIDIQPARRRAFELRAIPYLVLDKREFIRYTVQAVL